MKSESRGRAEVKFPHRPLEDYCGQGYYDFIYPVISKTCPLPQLKVLIFYFNQAVLVL